MKTAHGPHRRISVIAMLLLVCTCLGFATTTAHATNYDRSFGTPGTSTVNPMPVGSHATRVTGFNLPRITRYEIVWSIRRSGGSWTTVKTSNLGVTLAWGTLPIDWNGTRFLVEGDSSNYPLTASYMEVRAQVLKSGSHHEYHYWNITGQVPSYTVNASAGTGGSVTPASRTVTHGNTTTFAVSPTTHYERNSVSGDAGGFSWSGNTYTTAPVTQNRNLTFTFTGRPDLIVTAIWTEPATVYEGQKFRIKATVRNQGVATADAGRFANQEALFYLNGVKYGEGDDYDGLAPGAEITVQSIEITAPAAGNHTIRAVADGNAEVTESFETNNDRSATISVGLASTFVSAYWWAPLDVYHGATVTMCAEVEGIPVDSQCTFQVFEDDGILLPDDPVLPILSGRVYATEDGKTYVKATWIAKWQDDQSGDPEYYFKVSYGSITQSSSRSAAAELRVRQRQLPSPDHGNFYYSGGESTRKTALTDDRVPVILVHGASGDKKMHSLNYWFGWVNDDPNAPQPRFNQSDMSSRFRVYRYVYDSSLSIAQNGQAFAAFLDQFYANNPDLGERQVVVMAHSMGGLVSRYALNISSSFRDKVHRLVTLGTPHLGSPLANPTWVTKHLYDKYGVNQVASFLDVYYNVNFGGSQGDFDLAWHSTSEIPTSAKRDGAHYNWIKFMGYYDQGRLDSSLSSPFCGSANMTSVTGDSRIIAYGGYFNSSIVGEGSNWPDKAADEVDNDHGKLHFVKGVFRDMKYASESAVGNNDGLVPLSSALFGSIHTGVEKIDLTQSRGEFVDHSSYLDVPTTMDFVAKRLLTMVRVTMSPQNAITAGARWRIADGTWQKSGVSLNALQPGQYTIEFKDVAGWTKPGNQTVTVTENQTYTLSGAGATYSAANNAPTDILLSGTTVAENQPSGTTVGTLSATDPDAGNTFTYTLVSEAGGADNDNGSFMISGNSLRTAAMFDYETKSSYSARIRTTDQGDLWYEKAFTITVGNVNETPTDILLSISTVTENQPSGTTVGTLSTTDPDAGNTFTYTLVSGSDSADNGSFTINGITLRTAAPFNFEAKSTYGVRVRTTDQGGLWYEKAFTITVGNETEMPTDTMPPLLTISSPANGARVTTSSLTVSGTASDSGRGNSGIRSVMVNDVRANNDATVGSGTANWSRVVNLAVGINTITAVATDGAGNSTSHSLNVTYTSPDGTPPIVRITLPTSTANYTTTAENITLVGVASDDLGLTHLTWSNNRGGGGMAIGTDHWTANEINLQSGQNILVITAFDSSGNQTQAKMTVTYNPPNNNLYRSATSVWDGSNWNQLPAFSDEGYWFSPDDSDRMEYNGLLTAVWVQEKGERPDGEFWWLRRIQSRIAMWDGSSWISLGGVFDGQVLALATLHGDLFAAGYFTSVGGFPANSIARWDGVNWHPLEDGIDGAVYSLAVLGDQLFVGGSFASKGSSVALWQESGWRQVGGVQGVVRSLLAVGDTVFAGGTFEAQLEENGGAPVDCSLRGRRANLARLTDGEWIVPRGACLENSVERLSFAHGIIYADLGLVGGVGRVPVMAGQSLPAEFYTGPNDGNDRTEIHVYDDKLWLWGEQDSAVDTEFGTDKTTWATFGIWDGAQWTNFEGEPWAYQTSLWPLVWNSRPIRWTALDDPSRFRVVAGSFAWEEAREDAERQGGHLATFANALEWQAGRSVWARTGGRIWIGGLQAGGMSGAGSGWSWVTGEPWDFEAWAPGEPNDFGGVDEDRLDILASGGWNDAAAQTRQGYLMELPGGDSGSWFRDFSVREDETFGISLHDLFGKGLRGRFRLAGGPTGMVLTGSGAMIWKPSESHVRGEHPVILEYTVPNSVPPETNQLAFSILLERGGFTSLHRSHFGSDFESSSLSRFAAVVAANQSPWVPRGGSPEGFLALTFAKANEYTALVFPGIPDSDAAIAGFRMSCDVRAGNGTRDRVADGFSFSFAREGDPVLLDPGNQSGFAGGCCAETGTRTGLAVSFDTWSGNTFPGAEGDATDVEGLIVRVDHRTVAKVELPTRNGAPGDATSLQTGPRDAAYWAGSGDPLSPAAWATLTWQPLVLELKPDGRFFAWWKGVPLLEGVETGFVPGPGRFVLAGRTANSVGQVHLDNLRLSVIPRHEVASGQTLVVPLKATDPDLPAQNLSYEVVQGPPGLTVDEAGVMRWTPTVAQGPSSQTVAIRISDDASPPEAIVVEYQVVVLEGNRAPELDPIPDQVAAAGVPFEWLLTGRDPDLPPQPLTFALVSGPTGMTVARDGWLRWTPAASAAGSTFEVTVLLMDGQLSTRRSFRIAVGSVNRPPVLVPVPEQALDEGNLLSLDLEASDPDLPPQQLVFSLVRGPVGMTVTPAGALRWQTGELDGPATVEVEVAVTDNGEPPLSATSRIVVTVREVNQAPELDPIPDQVAAVGIPFEWMLTGRDPDLPPQPLTFAMVSGPTGMTVARDGWLRWTPAATAVGSTFEVTVFLTDGQLNDRESFRISVPAAVALRILPPRADGRVVLEIRAPLLKPLIVEQATVIGAWSVLHTVLGLGMDVPVELVMTPGEGVGPIFWRVREE
ncbi:MAG: cadherin domain-containing protein [Verrucomicrobiae bacterium]|nr:cadherin domain-containing protein [Verrucomicrobiae bacterium]